MATATIREQAIALIKKNGRMTAAEIQDTLGLNYPISGVMAEVIGDKRTGIKREGRGVYVFAQRQAPTDNVPQQRATTMRKADGGLQIEMRQAIDIRPADGGVTVHDGTGTYRLGIAELLSFAHEHGKKV